MITQADLQEQIQNGTAPLLIDVRTQEEYDRGSIPGAINIPHDVIGDKILVEAPDKDTPMILFCRTGNRCGIALNTLHGLGYAQAEPLEDGYDRWVQEHAN